MATLDEFEQSNVLEQAARLSEVIEAGLSPLAKLEAIEAVRGEGAILYDAAGEQRKAIAAATSSGVPGRPTGVGHKPRGKKPRASATNAPDLREIWASLENNSPRPG